MTGRVTAFEKTAQLLGSQLREAVLDHQAFETPLRQCDLVHCRATCCYDGAVLSEEEAAFIRGLLEHCPGSFADSSIQTTTPAIVTKNGALKTAVIPSARDHRAPDFPSHFAHTRCVFLDHENKCTLQLHSVAQGESPWFYKPISCWMHPVLLRPPQHPEGRPTLTLRTAGQDEDRFASCTPCGRFDPTGPPARETLRSELEALSQISGRDFLAELDAPPF